MPRTIQASLAILLVIVLPATVLAGETGNFAYSVTHDGGSLAGLKPGNGLKLMIEPAQARFTKSHQDVQIIPAASITEISYGQDVHRRVGAAIGLAVVSFGIGALMALTKFKKHYVGITWVDGDKKGGMAIQCDKNEYRGILAGLEGITGKKAVDSTTMTVRN